MIPQYLTGVLIHAGDLPLHEGGQVRVLPGVLIKMEREVLAAAPTLPMYQRVLVVPFADAEQIENSLRQARERWLRAEAKHDDFRRVLAWFIEQFRGESGAGESHWEQYPEYREALRLINPR